MLPGCCSVPEDGWRPRTREAMMCGRSPPGHRQRYNGEWKSLVAAMEGTLRLHHHDSGALVREAKYLHQRTGGVIGSLAHLIRSAAIRWVLDETEHITRALLDTVLIDYAAHTSARRAAS
jgi:hypothetical protein